MLNANVTDRTRARERSMARRHQLEASLHGALANVKLGMPIPAALELTKQDCEIIDASRYERVRDCILLFFANHAVKRVFLVLAILTFIGVAFAGVAIAWAILGLFLGVDNGGTEFKPICTELAARWNQTLEPQYIPMPPGSEWGWSRTAPVESCTLNQLWFNRCIKAFTVLFSYINFLPIPWRVSIFVHAWCSNRENSAGHSFYGRPTDQLYFNIPRGQQRFISTCLNLAYIAHFASLAMHGVYPTFMHGQTWPGAFAQNVPFVASILFALMGAQTQTCAEDRLIAAHPDKYPPRFGTVFKAAFRRWRAATDEDRGVGLLALFRNELGKFRGHGRSGSDVVSGLTGVMKECVSRSVCSEHYDSEAATSEKQAPPPPPPPPDTPPATPPNEIACHAAAVGANEASPPPPRSVLSSAIPPVEDEATTETYASSPPRSVLSSAIPPVEGASRDEATTETYASPPSRSVLSSASPPPPVEGASCDEATTETYASRPTQSPKFARTASPTGVEAV